MKDNTPLIFAILGKHGKFTLMDMTESHFVRNQQKKHRDFERVHIISFLETVKIIGTARAFTQKPQSDQKYAESTQLHLE